MPHGNEKNVVDCRFIGLDVDRLFRCCDVGLGQLSIHFMNEGLEELVFAGCEVLLQGDGVVRRQLRDTADSSQRGISGINHPRC